MTRLLREANRIITLWRNHGPATPRIDLKLALKEIVIPSSGGDNAAVIEGDFDSFEGLMYRPIPQKRSWLIGVNKNIAYAPRRNFTLAHEIGHFIGHRDLREKFQCGPEAINDFDVEPLEAEANEFAAHLLMPPDLVRAYDERRFCVESVTALADEFGVSKLAAAYRWINLTRRHIGFCKSRDGYIISGRASQAAYSKGLYFRGQDELPPQSRTALAIDNLAIPGVVSEGVWCRFYPAYESAYATTEGDYIYTFVDLIA